MSNSRIQLGMGSCQLHPSISCAGIVTLAQFVSRVYRPRGIRDKKSYLMNGFVQQKCQVSRRIITLRHARFRQLRSPKKVNRDVLLRTGPLRPFSRPFQVSGALTMFQPKATHPQLQRLRQLPGCGRLPPTVRT